MPGRSGISTLGPTTSYVGSSLSPAVTAISGVAAHVYQRVIDFATSLRPSQHDTFSDTDSLTPATVIPSVATVNPSEDLQTGQASQSSSPSDPHQRIHHDRVRGDGSTRFTNPMTTGPSGLAGGYNDGGTYGSITGVSYPPHMDNSLRLSFYLPGPITSAFMGGVIGQSVNAMMGTKDPWRLAVTTALFSAAGFMARRGVNEPSRERRPLLSLRDRGGSVAAAGNTGWTNDVDDMV